MNTDPTVSTPEEAAWWAAQEKRLEERTVEIGPDDHKHKCKFCGLVWCHHNGNDVRHGDYGAHECPACHRCNWSLGIYDGPELPAVRNGREPA